MMLLISHRGNLKGPNTCVENHPDSILKALDLGFHCEIDVWKTGEIYYLGHDKPEYAIQKKFLNDSRLWIHCKNLESLSDLIELDTNVFYHQNDFYTLTSKKIIWTYPGHSTNKNCVIVVPEYSPEFKLDCYGLCSDWVELYKASM